MKTNPMYQERLIKMRYILSWHSYTLASVHSVVTNLNEMFYVGTPRVQH